MCSAGIVLRGGVGPKRAWASMTWAIETSAGVHALGQATGGTPHRHRGPHRAGGIPSTESAAHASADGVEGPPATPQSPSHSPSPINTTPGMWGRGQRPRTHRRNAGPPHPPQPVRPAHRSRTRRSVAPVAAARGVAAAWIAVPSDAVASRRDASRRDARAAPAIPRRPWRRLGAGDASGAGLRVASVGEPRHSAASAARHRRPRLRLWGPAPTVCRTAPCFAPHSGLWR